MMMKTEDLPQPLSLQAQIRVLLDYGRPEHPEPSLSELAEATGLSDQTWANLLQGKSTNPRLNTLLALCQYFDVSLDYFACTSEDACRTYLYAHRLRDRSPHISDIEAAASRLSPRGQRNVLAMMEWMRRAARSLRSTLT